LATTGALRGRVVDEAGMPIADAKVTGCFQIPGMERGTYRLTVRTQRDAPLMEPMS